VGAIEAALYIKNKTVINLPEQQVIDCSTTYGNQGCNGGLMDYVFKYVKANKLTTETAYPYVGKQTTCQKVTGTYGVTGYTDVTAQNPTAMMNAVAIQPVSIALAASSSAFQLYKSGVLNSSACGTALDHGVIVVGYGTDSATNTPYWLVRNSWGASWGEAGYIRIYRSSSNGVGMCGLLSEPSYPQV
jgi:KDEL-tailed cysteine endopeptidase